MSLPFSKATALWLSCLLVLLSAPGRADAASVDQADFCVDESGFEFDLLISASDGEVVLRVGADSSSAFSAPVERIQVNFDGLTGAITRDAVPKVATFDDGDGTPPPFDRWQDGEIADATIVEASPGVWRFSGTIAHGPDRFHPGDFVEDVGLRFFSARAVTGPVEITSCGPFVSVPSTVNPPLIDGQVGLGEWTSGAELELTNGRVSFLHDRLRLYVLINLFADSGDDPFWQGGADQFWLMFDVDEDGQITPGVDRRYRLLSGSGNLRYETFEGDAFFFNSPAASTHSARGEGFGCFLADGSRTVFPSAQCNEHRLWELAIDLREIDAVDDRSLRFGLLIQSGIPEFVESNPADLASLDTYVQGQLQGDPTITAVAGETILGPNVLDVLQAIQDPDNPVDLVAGKRTAARVIVGEQPDRGRAIVSLYGERNGVDLPGSPLTGPAQRFPTTEDLRSDLAQAEIFRLPSSWTEVGSIDLSVRTRQPWMASAGASTSVAASFIDTITPTYWVVPYNTGTDANPVLIDEGDLTRDERETIAALPVSDINFVRRPPVVENPGTPAAFIDSLNDYYQASALAWTFGLLLTGSPPFEFPEQIVGARRTGYPGSQPGTTTIGMSDPIWFSGAGNVSWIAHTRVDYNLAHELIHNLDTKTVGTWGRHVSDSCGTEPNGDSQWPYSNDDIQEYGLLTVALPGLPAPAVVGDSTPDFMSYCINAPQVDPNNWISPYRWNALLGEFSVGSRAAARAAAVDRGATLENAFYVSGHVHQDGSGVLEPIIAQPGPIETPVAPGSHAIDLLACDDSTLSSFPFSVSFISVELEPREMSPFSFILPDPGTACAIVLRNGDTVLARREVSTNAPLINVTSPNGGEVWDGTETISWSATDEDGDDLSATVFYSSDGGQTWVPVANGIRSVASYEVDSADLEGSADALVRVVVSDGVNTAFDDSDEVFTVSEKAPHVRILGPTAGIEITNDRPVQFQGTARRVDGQSINGDAMRWSLNGSLFGLGESAEAYLDTGTYTVVLEAEADGLTGQDSLRFDVISYDTIFISDFESAP